jgi:dTDP-L-rhamnose 4-epimerase
MFLQIAKQSRFRPQSPVLLHKVAPMRVLVTGGAGFIGSQIVDLLIEEGHEVRVLDLLLESAHGGTPDYLNPAAEFIHGDVTDPATASAAMAGIDAVSHQAAMVGLGLDLGDAPDYVRHNDLGTAVLLAALANRRFAGRIVLASSMVVYGEGRYVCPTHGGVTPGPRLAADLDAGRFEPGCPRCGEALAPAPIAESDRLDPRNVYAATKLHQEHLSLAFARETDATLVTLRYHNVYGPRMPRDTPYAGVASIFASSLASGRSPQVFEDGGQLRDFVHVRDVALANVLALATPDAAGPYNVASGVPRTVLEMATALAAAHGDDAPEAIVTGQYRLGDVRHVFASPRRAADELGFEAREDFAEGMAGFAHGPLRAAA